ncbi:MAG: bifunctional 4-hydroxy-2-oxoglutarate aldolase/2-dehydro-3-deoxy-phosphogluconate aldolase [Spirochaetales bacterium]|nr:bifunctional 4-hydroxy-2-oxoglutarate aldolase/2-dehydro-3-deoxy-phosphogluconate aldolase [Spirochaetales bacterium]
MFETTAERMAQVGVIPVITVKDVGSTLETAAKAIEKGIGAVEITFRTTEGLSGYRMIADAIKAVVEKYPELIVGAGTVINGELASMAKDAGAQFIVSPGLNPATVEWCLKNKMPVFPGVATPSEVELALSYGLTYLKFFPAEALGGIKMLKALSGPFPQVKFMPTGGINADNYGAYKELKNVFCVGGSWVLK